MALQMSITRRTRDAKLKAAAGAFAIQMAKERKDPLYTKFKRFRDKFWAMKIRIKQKYGPKAMVKARMSMTRSSEK
jgi:hypothetical protein